MAFTNPSDNDSNLFSLARSNLNYTESSTSELNSFIKSLNIVNPDELSKEDLSLILSRIDSYEGLFSTQQLENIDYSKFSNHVFFNSAVNKVTSSFDRIQKIPYDSDELENIKYFNKTSGYTKHILDKLYPKSKGFVRFDSTHAVVVFDEQGKVLNDSKEKKVGLLSPAKSRFSFNFWIKPNSAGFVNNQVVFKKIQYANNKVKNGYICYISEVSSQYFINFKSYVDEKTYNTRTKISLDQWQNIVININIDKKVSFIIDGENIHESNITADADNPINKKSFPDEFRSKNIPFVIGGIFYTSNNSILNSLTDNDSIAFNNFKGDIDEFRVFFKFRGRSIVKKEMHKNIYAQKGLRLYLRFNEPGGNYVNSCLSIDHSGNKLHGLLYDLNPLGLENNTTNLKINSDSPLNLEKLEDSPVLNAAYTPISNLRKELVSLAKDYDNNNPNLIFNIMPKHYFLNASDFQNLPVYSNDADYTAGSQITASNLDISASQLNANIPANNELVNIVLIWANFFDKLKMYISSITNILNVDYDAINEKKSVAMQIPLLCKIYGLDFKEIFPSITKNKLNKENLKFDDVISELSIRKIQNLLWQRFLINTQDFLKSKGTIRSIETAFGSFGINHKNIIDIKEYSFNNEITQDRNYFFKTIDTFAANFGNIKNIGTTASFTNITEGYSINKAFLEILDIESKASDQSNISDTIEKGLSKNDWSIELFLNYNNEINKKRFIDQSKINQTLSPLYTYNNTQTLFVLDTGTANNDDGAVIIAKYTRSNSFNSNLGNIIIDIQPIIGTNFNTTLTLNNVNIFDVQKHLVLTQTRTSNNIVYTATLSNVGNQVILKKPLTSSKTVTITGNSLDSRITNNEYSFLSTNRKLNLRIGDYKYNTNNYLNSIITNNALFEGEILKIRLWKHALSSEEILSHSKNIKNFGKKDNNPLKTLILDAEVKNISRSLVSNEYIWNVEDISNNSVLNNSNIESLNTCKVKTKNQNQSNDLVIKDISLTCKDFNIKFDEANSYNKVNIISYDKNENKELTNNDNLFPAHEIPLNYQINQVNRVSVDMSIVKTVNEDISKIVSDISDFTSKISNATSIYEYQYQNIVELRKSYFDKFSDSNYINYASIGNVFKYFDNIMSSILFDIVPSRVRFEGFNFVYESHSLERHKYEYKNKDSINTIIDSNKFNFSRDAVLSRRNLSYNSVRQRSS